MAALGGRGSSGNPSPAPTTRGPLLLPHPIARASATADGVFVLALQGELDVATTAAVDAALQDGLAPGPAAVVLDLTAVTFADSTALSLIVRLRRRLGPAQALATVAPPGSAMRQLLGYTATEELVGAAASLDAALRAVAHGPRTFDG